MVDRAQQSKENARCGDLSPTMTVIARIGAMAAHIPYIAHGFGTYEHTNKFVALGQQTWKRKIFVQL